MGSDNSKNEIDSALNVTAKSVTDIYQGVGMSCGVNNEFFSNHCNLKNVTIDQNATCAVDVEAMQTAAATTNVKQDVSNEISQFSKAVKQNISLNPGSAESENITKTIVNLETDISNNIAQDCISDLTSHNIATCANSDWNGVLIKQKTGMDGVTKCIMNSNVMNQTTQTLSQVIDQKSTAEEANTLAEILKALVWVLLAAAVLLAVFLGLGGKEAGEDAVKVVKTPALQIGLVVLFLGLAGGFVTKMVINSKHPEQLRGNDAKCGDCSLFTNKDACEAHMCKWDVSDKANPQCICDPTSDLSCKYQCYLQADKDSCAAAKCGWIPDATWATIDKKKYPHQCTGSNIYCT